MGKPKYEFPTSTFPYRITKRLNLMSLPRRYFIDTGEGMPAFTPRGIRKSAVTAHISDRVNDIAWPYTRRILLLKKQYKKMFSEERLERIERMLELSNATPYSKLANTVLDLKKPDKDAKVTPKKRGWSETEWKKHMDYIVQIANPKPDFPPEPVQRGTIKPLTALLPRIKQIAQMPEFKIYKRPSEEDWYRDPLKVPESAKKYVITERVKKLATPKAIPQQD